MKKVAILGGSFDPIHEGHLQMARTALNQLHMDEVWLMPTKSTPLKDRELTSQMDRLHMIERAIQNEPQMFVSTLEFEREGKSYTYDTLKVLQEKNPDIDFTWLIGNDQLEQFHAWKNAEELVKMAHFVCFDRDGRFGDNPYGIQCIHMTMVPVSSSEVRKGNKLNYVPENVIEYMYEHRLYIKNFVEERVKPKRFNHSVSVAQLCEKFAMGNHLDPQVAYITGLFHDICKSMPVDEMKKWMEATCPEKLDCAIPTWHGFVGAEVVDRIFYIHDERIKQAIYHHVFGSSQEPYAMMVFCADKLDPLRGYDSSAMIEACTKDIQQGFAWVKEENRKYLNRGK